MALLAADYVVYKDIDGTIRPGWAMKVYNDNLCDVLYATDRGGWMWHLQCVKGNSNGQFQPK